MTSVRGLILLFAVIGGLTSCVDAVEPSEPAIEPSEPTIEETSQELRACLPGNICPPGFVCIRGACHLAPIDVSEISSPD
jgi:hypothetical protein